MILERVKELPVEKQAVFERWMKHVFLAEMDEKEKEQFHKLWEENERSEGMFTTHAISEMIREMKVKEKTEGRKEGKAEGKVENTIELIMRKLDQGLSAEAIACWMELDESYVKEIGEFHRMYPEETGEKIAERSLKAKENDKNE